LNGGGGLIGGGLPTLFAAEDVKKYEQKCLRQRCRKQNQNGKTTPLSQIQNVKAKPQKMLLVAPLINKSKKLESIKHVCYAIFPL
jgi:PleD family two-component response regulator